MSPAAPAATLQRRLADARIASEDERGAITRARTFDQMLDPFTLDPPPYKHMREPTPTSGAREE